MWNVCPKRRVREWMKGDPKETKCAGYGFLSRQRNKKESPKKGKLKKGYNEIDVKWTWKLKGNKLLGAWGLM